jgi:hypothetical protein
MNRFFIFDLVSPGLSMEYLSNCWPLVPKLQQPGMALCEKFQRPEKTTAGFAKAPDLSQNVNHLTMQPAVIPVNYSKPEYSPGVTPVGSSKACAAVYPQAMRRFRQF